MFTKRAEDCAQPQSPGSFASGSLVKELSLSSWIASTWKVLRGWARRQMVFGS